jgi:hypothetical protein
MATPRVSQITTRLPWSPYPSGVMVCAPFISLSLPTSLNALQFLSSESNSNNGALLSLHDSYGWLAYALFLTRYLDACEKISLGNSYLLSSWCLRYGLMIWSYHLMHEFLGIYLKILKTLCKAPLWYAAVLPRPYDVLVENLILICCLLIITLSFVKLLWPLWEFFSCFHDQDLCAHHHFPLLCFYTRS